jgi:hypothetical protein
MRKLLLALFLALAFPAQAWAAAIAHTFVEQNSSQSTTSASYGDVTGATITSGNFTAGKKYLIWVTAHVNPPANSLVGYQVIHGSTAFAESEFLTRSDEQNGRAYLWFTVWEAVSSEGITFQIKSDGTLTNAVDQVAIFAMNLSDDLVENTDWCFNERSNNDALSTSPVGGGACTITPAGASDWLVASYAQVDLANATNNLITALVRSGEASTSLPQGVFLAATATDQELMALSRVFALTGVSNTFTEQSSAAASAHTRLHSGLFMLNLDKFAGHSSAYTEADANLGTSAFGNQLQTIGITPAAIGDVWVGAYWGFDQNNANRNARFRVQIDGADVPTGQTTDLLLFRTFSDQGETPMHLSTMVTNMTAAAHTIDLDAAADATTGTPAAQQATLWAVTMELPGGAPPPPAGGVFHRRIQ